MLIAVLMIISEMQVMADIQVNQPKEPPKQEQSKDFYQTQAWKKLRYKVLCKYEATCQCCGRSRREGQIMHVDHILPRSKAR
jgi:5-methylcytosine-specific restriction endonuclease McrA